MQQARNSREEYGRMMSFDGEDVRGRGRGAFSVAYLTHIAARVRRRGGHNIEYRRRAPRDRLPVLEPLETVRRCAVRSNREREGFSGFNFTCPGNTRRTFAEDVLFAVAHERPAFQLVS